MKSLIFLAFAAVAFASDTSDRAKADLIKLESADAADRLHAFYDLTEIGCPRCHNSEFLVLDGFQNVIRLAGISRQELIVPLNRLLTTETALVNSGQDLSQEVCDYLGDLVQVVAYFHDRSSSPVLMPFIVSGNMAQDGIAAMGEVGLASVQSQIANPTSDISRDSAFRIARKMTLQKNIARFDDPNEGREQLRQILESGLSESSHFARGEAIDGLTELGDLDAIPRLQSIARTDPYVEQSGVELAYPLRTKAAAAVAKLAVDKGKAN